MVENGFTTTILIGGKVPRKINKNNQHRPDQVWILDAGSHSKSSITWFGTAGLARFEHSTSLTSSSWSVRIRIQKNLNMKCYSLPMQLPNEGNM